MTQPELSGEQKTTLLQTLQARFKKNMHRHPGLEWMEIQRKLEANPQKLWSLFQMEDTGGEPDVIGKDAETGGFLFYDCSPESPKARRSLCYDLEAWESRKEHKPKDSAMEMAEAMGIQLLTEEEYRALQQLDAVDQKNLELGCDSGQDQEIGGALFCDRRFDTVFLYHNGAESYYAARGFRGKLIL